MEEDFLKLFEYMKGHHNRLGTDIENALKKEDIDNKNFYEGAQNATKLFINLMDDIIKKHS